MNVAVVVVPLGAVLAAGLITFLVLGVEWLCGSLRRYFGIPVSLLWLAALGIVMWACDMGPVGAQYFLRDIGIATLSLVLVPILLDWEGSSREVRLKKATSLAVWSHMSATIFWGLLGILEYVGLFGEARTNISFIGLGLGLGIVFINHLIMQPRAIRRLHASHEVL